MQTTLLHENLRTLFLAATVSLIAHGFLLLWLLDVRLFPAPGKRTEQSIFVALQTTLQNNNQQPVQVNTKPIPNQTNSETIHNKKEKAEPEKAVKQALPVNTKAPPTPSKLTEAPNTDLTTPDSAKQNTASGVAIYDSLSTIAKQYAKPDSDSQSTSSFIFDSKIEEQLNQLQNDKQNRTELKAMQKALNDERYKEFRSIGGQQMVRIDGKCFSKPEDNPLDEFDNPIMMGLGDCTKKEKIVFKSYAPHIIKKRQQKR